ncbi:MAG: hypothetical protein MK135_05295 [Polyangiaceae bacterium]|nr:hypothetical protein [Polyangiaceae bacterium]
MLNTMIIVHMKEPKYAEWKEAFDGDKERQAHFMKDAVVGRVDERTAMVTADVFDRPALQALLKSDEFHHMENEMGLSHEFFELTPQGLN